MPFSLMPFSLMSPILMTKRIITRSIIGFIVTLTLQCLHILGFDQMSL
jgi:hypothetical protein